LRSYYSLTVADWPQHKASCRLTDKFVEAGLATLPSDESPFKRHARLFSARYANSLMFVAILALDLPRDWSAIDRLGCLITVEPRPHAEAGARFKVKSFDVL
jgi:hypothetical protein